MVSTNLTNLITNGNFESSLTGWTANIDVDATYSISSSEYKFGSKSLRLKTGDDHDDYVDVYQDISITAGTRYIYASFWAKGTVSSTTQAFVGLYDGVTRRLNITSSLTTTWKRFSVVYSTSSGSISPQLEASSAAGFGTDVYFDGVIVVDITNLDVGMRTTEFMDALVDRRYSGFYDGTKYYVNTGTLTYTNMLNDGNFSEGSGTTFGSSWATGGTGAERSSDAYRSASYSAKVPGPDANDEAMVYQLISTTIGRKYYVTGYVRNPNTSSYNCYLYAMNSVLNYSQGSHTFPGTGTIMFTRGSFVFTASYSTTAITFKSGGFTGASYPAYADNIMVLDLTEIFGSDNEPTATDMDSYIGMLNQGQGWFDNTNPQYIYRDNFQNIVVDGDFEHGTSSWDTNGCTFSTPALPGTVAGQYQTKILGNYCGEVIEENGGSFVSQIRNPLQLSKVSIGNHYVYATALGKEFGTTTDAGMRIVVPYGTDSSRVEFTDTLSRKSVITLCTSNPLGTDCYMELDVGGLEDAPYYNTAIFDGAMLIDLSLAVGTYYDNLITTGAVDSMIGAFGEYWFAQPAAPTNVTCSASRIPDTPCYHKCSLSWDLVDGASYYRVYRKEGVGGTWGYIDDEASTSYEDDGNLNANTTYYYRITTMSVEGVVSDYSSEVSDTTDRNQPTAATITGITPGVTYEGLLTCALNWNVSTFPAGSIDYYQIERAAHGSSVWLVVGTTPHDHYTETESIGKSMEPNTVYDYRIKTFSTCSSDNESPYSSISSVTTLNVPGPPSSGTMEYSITEKKATITWEYPTNDGGTTVTNYIITSNIPNFGDPVIVSNTPRLFTYDGSSNTSFNADTPYSFYIKSKNLVGEGTSLLILKATSPPLPTNIPTPMLAESIVDGTSSDYTDRTGWKVMNITVSWSYTPPTGNVATPTDIRIYRDGSLVSQQGTGITSWVDGTADNAAHLINPNTGYLYKISLLTAWGESGFGQTRSITTSNYIPAAPTPVTAEWLYDSDTGYYIHMAWTQPGTTTYLTGYRLQRSPVYTGGSAYNLLWTPSSRTYDDYDLASGTYTFHVRPITNLWTTSNSGAYSITNYGLGTDSAAITLETPSAPSTLYVNHLGGRSGSYSNIFFNKLIWQIPSFTDEPLIDGKQFYNESNIEYIIYRNTIDDFGPASSKIKLGKIIGRDTAFYDAATPVLDPGSYLSYIQPNTKYYYKVIVTSDFGDSTYSGTIPTLGITSPNFSLYAPNNSGTGGWTCRAGLKIDDEGKPTITIRSDAATPVGSIIAEISENGRNWTKFGEAYVVDGSTECSITANNTNSSINYRTTYHVRMRAVDSDGKTTDKGTSNVIVVTTFSNDHNSFPNMMPNSGMQYGKANSTYISDDMELYNNDLYGTWQGYNKMNLSVFSGNIKLASFWPLGLKNINYNSGRGLLFISESDCFIKNIASYKFPTPRNTEFIGETRYYVLCGRFAKENNYLLPYGSPKMSIIEKNTAVATGSAMQLYINNGTTEEYSWIIDTGSLSYVPNDGIPDLFTGTYSDNSYTQQKFFNFKFSGSGATYKGSLGDLMIFDLSSVFGGNGGDIYDTASEVTSKQIYALIDNAIVRWWDFNYENCLENPPYQYLEAVVKQPPDVVDVNTIDIDLWSVKDITGGLDTCGYLPPYEYKVQYRRLGNEFFEEKTELFMNELENRYIETTLTPTDESILNGSNYQLRYVYSTLYDQSPPSEPIFIETLPVPDKIQDAYLTRTFTAGFSSMMLHWTAPNDNGNPITGYRIRYGATEDPSTWTSVDVSGALTTYPFPATVNEIYYCTIQAENDIGFAEESEIISGASTTTPSAPTNIRFSFKSADGGLTAVVLAYWDAPEDDGCSVTGNGGLIKYRIEYGTQIGSAFTVEYPSLSAEEDGFQLGTYKLSVGESIYFRIAAVTSYTNFVTTNLPGVYSDLQMVTYMNINEGIKMRGIANTDGYIDFYFTARTGDGSYVQYKDGDGNEVFYRLMDDGSNISVDANIYNIKNIVDNISVKNNLYLNGITRVTEWPTAIVQSVSTRITNDLFGEALEIEFEMIPDTGDAIHHYLYDVHTEQTGLDGIGCFLIITDYTTDISFYQKNQTEVDEYEIIDDTKTGSIVWTVNASFVYQQYKNRNENVPQIKQEFYVIINAGDVLFDPYNETISIYHKILDPATGLQKQLNDYFTSTEVANPLPEEIRQLYVDAEDSGGRAFVVTADPPEMGDDGKMHLKINIKTMMERVQNQISTKTTNLRSFYLATKPNTYYIGDQLMELRSFEDMYGRNKPGASFTGAFVKRSYGFRFKLDYIIDYEEEEASTIDLTPIPGTSSGNAIGLDVVGTTRTINITGVRVDNSNDWMFHAPFEYIDDPASGGSGEVMQGGVIYMGTSNWGWMKFMKAIMGTFQFIDGPYRLIMMTVPSSLMQQYVPDRACKYQYPDGTYIVQAGTEDMCYVMIESFQTSKNEEMFNAISYRLRLRRVLALGETI